MDAKQSSKMVNKVPIRIVTKEGTDRRTNEPYKALRVEDASNARRYFGLTKPREEMLRIMFGTPEATAESFRRMDAALSANPEVSARPDKTSKDRSAEPSW